jgi:hypothetical protein
VRGAEVGNTVLRWEPPAGACGAVEDEVLFEADGDDGPVAATEGACVGFTAAPDWACADGIVSPRITTASAGEPPRA